LTEPAFLPESRAGVQADRRNVVCKRVELDAMQILVPKTVTKEEPKCSSAETLSPITYFANPDLKFSRSMHRMNRVQLARSHEPTVLGGADSEDHHVLLASYRVEPRDLISEVDWCE